MIQLDYSITVNGVESTALAQQDALTRAVIICLFTWRRANPDDVTDGEKMGYWGDTAAPLVANDRIGSRLWLLAREKLTQSTINRAREYATEALQCLIDDGIASRIEVSVERFQLDGLALTAAIYRADGNTVTYRFDEAWEIIRAI